MNAHFLQRPVKDEGATVIALHGALGSAQEWESLADRLHPCYSVLAPQLRADAESHGRGTRAALSLDAGAALIEPLLDAVAGPVYLAGHEYGAAMALKLARRHRDRIMGLVLYQPTAFGLLLADPRSSYALLDVVVLRHVLGRYLAARDWLRAAKRYVDHAAGGEAWERLSAQERAVIGKRMPEICAQIDAVLADSTPPEDYARIDTPVLLLTSARTRVSTARVAQLLARTLPRVERRTVDAASHRDIDSHPEQVDREVQAFLVQHQRTVHRDPEPTRAFALPVLASHRRGAEHAEAVLR